MAETQCFVDFLSTFLYGAPWTGKSPSIEVFVGRVLLAIKKCNTTNLMEAHHDWDSTKKIKRKEVSKAAFQKMIFDIWPLFSMLLKTIYAVCPLGQC